eukprot:1159679-Pelagomonas_calceolata.AAC.7
MHRGCLQMNNGLQKYVHMSTPYGKTGLAPSSLVCTCELLSEQVRPSACALSTENHPQHCILTVFNQKVKHQEYMSFSLCQLQFPTWCLPRVPMQPCMAYADAIWTRMHAYTHTHIRHCPALPCYSGSPHIKHCPVLPCYSGCPAH